MAESETMLVARLEVKYGRLKEYLDIMAGLVPVFEEYSWRLVTS